MEVRKEAAPASPVFLEHKIKKKWVDEKSGSVAFMLYGRSLFITWGNKDYWIWDCFKETTLVRSRISDSRSAIGNTVRKGSLSEGLGRHRDENIEVPKLSHICWLDVRGKFNVSQLTPDAEYEIVYVVKLSKSAFGWELPITLRLTLPNGTIRHRLVSLLNKPKGEILELNLGHFRVERDETGEVCFDLYQHSDYWKGGLILHGAVIRPKN